MAGKAYVIIKWGDIKTSIQEINYNRNDTNKHSTNIASKDNSLLIGATELTSTNRFKKIMKFVSNVIPTNSNNKFTKIASNIFNMSSGKSSLSEKIENLSLKVLNPIMTNTAQKMGYGSFSELYSKIKYGAEGLISDKDKSAFAVYSNATAEQICQARESVQNQFTTRTYDGIVINVVTSDEESYDSDIPKRKVEDGYDLSSYVHNSNQSRSFEGFIADIDDSDTKNPASKNTLKTALEIKELLKKIRESKITFDIEIVGEGILYNCLFSSLSFTKSNQTLNGYNISFSVEPIVKDNISLVSAKITGAGNIGRSNTEKNHSHKSASKGNTKNKTINTKQSIPKKDTKPAKKNTFAGSANAIF